jgi:hypothetical protein
MPTDIRTPEQTLTQLHQCISYYFSEQELRTLCNDLGVDYDDVGTGGKAAQARDLVMYLERRGRTPDLIDKCKAERPNVDWDLNLGGTLPFSPRAGQPPAAARQYSAPQNISPARQPFALASLAKIRPWVDRLATYTEVMDLAEAILDDCQQFNRDVQEPLAAVGQPWWTAQFAHAQVNGKLAPSFGLLSKKLNEHTSKLNTEVGKLLPKHSTSIQELAAELDRTWKDAEQIIVSMRTGCTNAVKAAEAAAQAPLMTQLEEDLRRLQQIAVLLESAVRMRNEYLYQGIKECVQKLSGIIETIEE